MADEKDDMTPFRYVMTARKMYTREEIDLHELGRKLRRAQPYISSKDIRRLEQL